MLIHGTGRNTDFADRAKLLLPQRYFHGNIKNNNEDNYKDDNDNDENDENDENDDNDDNDDIDNDDNVDNVDNDHNDENDDNDDNDDIISSCASFNLGCQALVRICGFCTATCSCW